MPNKTTRLKLVKPLGQEFYDIDTEFNFNMDIIDDATRYNREELITKRWTFASGLIFNTLTGDPPFEVISTTMVDNLNVNYLEGYTASSLLATAGPSGSNGSIQFYKDGALSHDPNLMWNSNDSILNVSHIVLSGNVRLQEEKYLNWGPTSGLNGYGLRELDGNIQFKHEDGHWANIGSGTGSSIPSGVNQSIQYNEDGTYGGDEYLLWNYNNHTMTLNGTLTPGPSNDLIIKLGDSSSNKLSVINSNEIEAFKVTGDGYASGVAQSHMVGTDVQMANIIYMPSGSIEPDPSKYPVGTILVLYS